MKSILIFGRQPHLGLAEAISLYGQNNVVPFGEISAIVNYDPCSLNFNRLGGSLKLGRVLVEMDQAGWKNIETFLVANAPEQVKKMPDGKMTLGLSSYGSEISPKEVMATAIRIKKAIQKTGRSVRVVPNSLPALNSASVLHNRLTNDKSWELLVVRSGDKVIIGQTVFVQDINKYAKRDQQRPSRDARIGMLPPKLAQIIINLACPELKIDETTECQPEQLLYNQTVLDPFCGSGVIPQEALLMGYKAIGTDINPAMVNSSIENISWLESRFNLHQKAAFKAEEADATKAKWPAFDFVATETNLGRPLSSIPEEADFGQMIKELDDLISKFLINLSDQTKSGVKHCIAIPAWQTAKNQFRQLPLIDRLKDLGYNLVDFKEVNTKQLIYCRPDQLVARQLLIITKE